MARPSLSSPKTIFGDILRGNQGKKNHYIFKNVEVLKTLKAYLSPEKKPPKNQCVSAQLDKTKSPCTPPAIQRWQASGSKRTMALGEAHGSGWRGASVPCNVTPGQGSAPLGCILLGAWIPVSSVHSIDPKTSHGLVYLKTKQNKTKKAKKPQ